MDSDFFPLLGLALLLTVTPGPDTVLVIRNVLRGGVRGGVLTALGSASGLLIHLAASTLGISALLVHSAEAFNGIRLLGSCYLLWLGGRALWNALRGVTPDYSAVSNNMQQGRAWCEGFFTNVLNPKVAIFYLAVLPQVAVPSGVDASMADAFHRSILFGVGHIVIGIIWFSFLSCSLYRIRTVLMDNRASRILDGSTGALMTLFGLRLAMARL